ncbi:hypothetical protein AGR4B_pAt10013 [Agrobacterium tumefaciens str. CFBP 5621]|nr:hypothetical protein AGR4B_pAt10013 [Agrobacterium tumefaciens str. CFBP 5621]
MIDQRRLLIARLVLPCRRRRNGRTLNSVLADYRSSQKRGATSLSFVFSHDQASSFNLQACRFASTGGMLALHKGYYAKHPTAFLHSVTSREACTHLILSGANPGSYGERL